MKITKLFGREIFDSRGLPTIECTLVLDNSLMVTASVPAGISCGSHESYDLRDGGQRLLGKGVLKAIEHIESDIAPLVLGQEPDIVGMDLRMIEIDGTKNKERLGANSMLAVSMALCKAQAIMHEMEIYELIAHLCNLEAVTLPFPLFNLINGGMHAHNNLVIQECMIIPIGSNNFRHSFETAVQIFYALKNILQKKNKLIVYGDEGGFASDFEDEFEALDCLMEAIEKSGNSPEDVVIALDVAASSLYNKQTQRYVWHDQEFSSDELIALYSELAERYPLYSIEDGMAEDDYEGWQKLTKQLGTSLQIVGDDLFVTNPERIAYGVEQQLANAVVIKPNQIGTITETVQAIKLSQNSNMNVIVSHRSGETEETFIVDLAVGSNAGQLKAGGVRGERVAKYNQLLRIEDMFEMSLLGA